MYASWDAVKEQIINMNMVKPRSLRTTATLRTAWNTVPVRRYTGMSDGSLEPMSMQNRPIMAGAKNVECQPNELISAVPITGERMGPSIPSVAAMDRMRALS